MKRRNFIQLSTLTGVGASLPFSLSTFFKSCSTGSTSPSNFKYEVESLLTEWCDGMLKRQINAPDDLTRHGALACPSCTHIHGRCMDAVYPFLYMADTTGEMKYRDAAILVMQWAENNVSQDNGSWSVVPNPKSWKGITIFGAIALTEALHYHGHVLNDKLREAWTERLKAAAQYVYETFTIAFTNINYGGTAIYGLKIMGDYLGNQSYVEKSKALAEDVKAYFTESENLLFGECKPEADKLSDKGLHGVDLGYNVEETLNSIAMYALEVQDKDLLSIVDKTLEGHLNFMLPDGAWDNSWGTRQYKWSYWGSRTCDGSQPAFAFMADSNPAYGTAAIKNTQLLKRCTADGLLHGGPHFVSHGIPPCIHHTFTHAKPLATLLNHWEHIAAINSDAPLPRTQADGFNYYNDLDVLLLAKGDWRATLSAYDAEYHYKNDYRQATGASIGALYHNDAGLICAASMAIYKMVEPYNQQPAPGKDIALTPRIETFKNGEWFTNLFDLKAQMDYSENGGDLVTTATVQLKNESRTLVSGTAANFDLSYKCSVEAFDITVKPNAPVKNKTTFVLPIISPSGEKVEFVDDKKVLIHKPEGKVIVSANATIRIKPMVKARTFNMVPGVEAIPLEIDVNGNENLQIKLQFASS